MISKYAIAMICINEIMEAAAPYKNAEGAAAELAWQISDIYIRRATQLLSAVEAETATTKEADNVTT